MSPDFRINPDREMCPRGKNCPDYLNLIHDRNLAGLDHCWEFAHRVRPQAVYCRYSHTNDCGALLAWRNGNPTSHDLGHLLTYDHHGRCAGLIFFFFLTVYFF